MRRALQKWTEATRDDDLRVETGRTVDLIDPNPG